MKKTVLLTLITVLALATFGVIAYSGIGAAGEYGLAEFDVRNLTCGSCVKNIQTALADVKGVGEVDVSVTSGRTRVMFDAKRIDPAALEAKISEAGYPAKLNRILSAAEYRDFQEDATRLAKDYVARIGDRLISRVDFEKGMDARRGPKASPEMDAGLRRVVWDELLQRELLLLSAEKNGVVVQDGEVAVEIDKMRKGMKDFDSLIEARFGGVEAFAGRLKQDMIINRNIEENVLGGVADKGMRQAAIDKWYGDLFKNTPVEILDPALKAATTRGGCGGSCCG